MTDLEKTLHIEFGQLIDKMNNGLIHPHTTRMKLVEKAMETFALYNVVGRSEQLKAFADYVQGRMWGGEDKDLSEFVEEFLSL